MRGFPSLTVWMGMLYTCTCANKSSNSIKVSTNAIAANVADCSLWLHILAILRRILLNLRKFWITNFTNTETVCANVVFCTTVAVLIISFTENVFVGNIPTGSLYSNTQPIGLICPLRAKELTFMEMKTALINTQIFGENRRNFRFNVTVANSVEKIQYADHIIS